MVTCNLTDQHEWRNCIRPGREVNPGIHLESIRVAASGRPIRQSERPPNHKDQKTTAGYAYFQTKERHKALDKHGRNVIDFATRLPAASADNRDRLPALSVNLPPSRGPLHSFTREALYKLVWSEPTRTVSRRLGISDVGLAKACTRARIPTPDRGYWARVRAGQECEKTPSPVEATQNIEFRGRQPAGVAEEERQA
jgi:hypothetical protein